MGQVIKEECGMSMEISGSSGITTQLMELKTETAGVTRKEEIKTGFASLNDYSKYLQGKYDYMNTGTTNMHGVPTTVTVSSAFLKKCNGNPEKAAYLEENLAAIPQCIKDSVSYIGRAPGSPTMTYCNISVDDKGNISMTSGSTNDPDGKIARENAKRKAEEEKAAEKKLAERHAKKKTEDEKIQERLEKTQNARYDYSVTGSSIKDVTSKMLEIMTGSGINTGIDLKA